MIRVHWGHIFHLSGRPTAHESVGALVSIPDGALAVGSDGRILYCGPRAGVPASLRAAPAVDHRPGFLLPGFVDTHLHFAQTFAADAWAGGDSSEWLDTCVFPAETRLSDPAFARWTATAFCDRRIAAGTTAALVFGSAFRHAQDALFAETHRRGLRMVSGRGIQTAGGRAAAPLLTAEAEVTRSVRAEIDAWHAADTGDVATALLHAAIVPRSPTTVTRETLRNLGELYDRVRDRGVYFHSHLCEDTGDDVGGVDAIRRDYGVRRCLDVFDGRFLPGSSVGGVSLLGRRSVLAHAVRCDDTELARMAQTGVSIAHCPVSQQFLGAPTLPWRRTVGAGVTVAAGSDYGGGDEWAVPRVLASAYKVHLGERGADRIPLHPALLLFTGTLAGARALDMEDRFGNLDPGKEADFLVVDPGRSAPLAATLAHGVRSADPVLAAEQTLFALLMGMTEAVIAQVHVQGRRIDDH